MFSLFDAALAVLANADIKAAYPKLAFTGNPWGRAVIGCSSGGAAALSMGWFRPDLFRRVQELERLSRAATGGH